ncbi:MAG: hypothetical protein NC391_04635 [Alistipes timonensis]|nr:hypothetical protein [Alistipes timonensis]MCM1140712.1 hypothetical protein [Muribaculum sp.]
MEPRYVLLLDYNSGNLTIIRLTDDELKVSERYDDFEEFLATLEDRYQFWLKDCNWMTTESLTIYRYEDGKEVSND